MRFPKSIARRAHTQAGQWCTNPTRQREHSSLTVGCVPSLGFRFGQTPTRPGDGYYSTPPWTYDETAVWVTLSLNHKIGGNRA